MGNNSNAKAIKPVSIPVPVSDKIKPTIPITSTFPTAPTKKINDVNLDSVSMVFPPMVEPDEEPSIASVVSEEDTPESWDVTCATMINEAFIFNCDDQVSPPLARQMSESLHVTRGNYPKIFMGIIQDHELVARDNIVDKFDDSERGKDFNSRMTAKEKLTNHFLLMIETHIMLVDMILANDWDRLNGLIKQITLAHALMEITPEFYRELHHLALLFFMKHRFMGEEQLHAFVTYFNMVLNMIEDQYQQFLHANYGNAQSGRHSNARANYRLMKRWRQHVETVKNSIKPAQEKIANNYRCKKEYRRTGAPSTSQPQE